MLDDVQLLEALVRLTGDLFPTGTSSYEQLEDVRRALLRALRRGQTEAQVVERGAAPRPWPRPDAIVDVSAPVEIRAMIAEADDGQAPTPLVFRRTRPAAPWLAPEGLPAWARGRRPARTLGPFVEADVRPVWFDIWESAGGLLVSRRSIAVGRPPEPVLRLTEARILDANTIEVGAGGVWLRSAAFDMAAPLTSWFGIAAAGGRLVSDQPFSSGAGPAELRVPSDARLRLEIDLPAPATIPDAAGPLGADARSVTLTLPQHLAVEMPQGPGTVTPGGGIGLTVFGTSLGLAQVPASTPRFDAGIAAMIVPLPAEQESLTIARRQSDVCRMAGRAPILGAGLAFPVADLPRPLHPSVLGLVEGRPAVHLNFGAGLTLDPAAMRDSAGARMAIGLGGGDLLAREGEIWLSGSPPAQVPGEELLVPTWQAADVGAGIRTGIRLRHAGMRGIEFGCMGSGPEPAECVARRGVPFRATLDRPLPAAGRPFPLEGEATVEDVVTPAGTTVLLRADHLDPILALMPRSFALDNALLRTRRITAWELQAVRREGGLAPGWMTFGFELDLLAPALPDPYASDFLPWDTSDPGRVPSLHREPFARLVAAADWRGPREIPAVAFGLEGARPPLVDHGSKTYQRMPGREDRARIERFFAQRLPPGFERCRLLDVSGAVDHLGISLFTPANADGMPELDRPEPFELDGLTLTAPIGSQHLFLLPGFQNEAVANTAQPNAVPAFPPLLPPFGDGGAQRLAAMNPRRVPVAVWPLAGGLVNDFGLLDQPLEALFNLPFGIKAAASVERIREDGGTIEFVRAGPREAEQDVQSAWQLRLVATGAPDPQDPTPESPSLRGVARQLKLGVDPSSGDATSAIGEPFTTFFNNEFSFTAQRPRIPVRRIDLSGGGNNLVSDWLNPKAGTTLTNVAGVRQARFEALLGRAIYEVVKIASVCHPWNLAVVRDVTLRRTAAGGVWRTDSGWQAASDALVDYDPVMGVRRHLGPVRGLRAVGNIREIDQVLTAPGGILLRAVRFDAGAEIDGIDGIVPIRDVAGWVQIEPSTALTPAQLYDALRAEAGAPRGPVYGRLDARIEPGGTGQQINVHALGIELTREPGGQTALCGTLRGSPVLPRRGSWTLTRKDKGQPAPRRLEVGELLPVVSDAARYLVREPADLFAAAPVTEYGLLHSSEAHRFLLRDLAITPGDNGLAGLRPPLFADQFAMAGHAALVPPPERCIELPAGTVLRIPEPGHLLLELPGGELAVPANGAGVPWRVMVIDQQGQQQALRLEYRDQDRIPTRLRLGIDTRAEDGRDWSLEMRQMSVTAEHDFLGNFATNSGTFTASSAAPARMEGPAMSFSDLLAPVQAIIDILKFLSFPTAFASLAGKGDVLVSFGGIINIPQKIPVKRAEPHPHMMKDLKPGADYAPIGGGKLKGEIGAFFTIYKGERGAHGFGGLNSGFRFEMGGKWLFPTGIPLLYAGGSLKFKYEYDSAPKRREPGEEAKRVEETLALYAGAVGNLGTGDNPLVEAELSATEHYVLKLVNGEFKFGIQYQIEAKVEVLNGLAELAGGFEAMVVPKRVRTPEGLDTDIVEVDIEAALAGEVTLGWVFHAEVEVPVKIHLGLGMPTFAAFALGNPLLIAGELV